LPTPAIEGALAACRATDEPAQKFLSALQVQGPLSLKSVISEIPAVAHPPQQWRSGRGRTLPLFFVDRSRVSYLSLTAQLICLPLPAVYLSLVVF